MNLPKFFSKPKFSLPLFIVAALATFVLLGGLLFFAVYLNLPSGDINYFLKDLSGSADPLITKVPGLKDVLAGPILNSIDPGRGDAKAAVTIVEFSDYQCAYCREQEKIISAVMNDYQEKIRFIWKDYPENNPASLSFKAAVAARCAGEQNKYWAYHDALYAEKDLTDETFGRLAKRINLNQLAFNNCRESASAREKILANIEEADALGISGIPFIFINQQEIMGQVAKDELKDIIERELKNN